ncbi:MAG: hypothetical protein JWM33_1170 [Caulobacteraceae bacterium]|nr:hypothetical protein [Caulobacteraceae bacterium]
MSQVTITDFAIWTKHVHGAKLGSRLSALRAGETVDLRIAGETGLWIKMSDGKDGRPTPGLRPVGKAKDFWRQLYETRRGELVDIDLIESEAYAGVEEAGRALADRVVNAAETLVKTEESRKAALEAFLSLAGQGWRSDGRTMTRDEMHER